MNAETIEIVSAMLGSPVVSHLEVSGGYTHAFRGVAQTSNGASAFVKAATDEATARWLRLERDRYVELSGLSFMPRCLGWQDGERPILVLEDHSADYWPPPWRPGDVEAVITSLQKLREVEPSVSLPRLDEFPGMFESWEVVAHDPEPFLSLGLVTPDWLRNNLPILIECASKVPLEGDSIVHLDVRSDNLVLIEDRALLIDWNWARKGNPEIDLAFWLPSLSFEGGPNPDQIMPDAPNLAALVSGFFAAKAGVPLVSPRTQAIKTLQIKQLRTSLPWACRALQIENPLA